VTPCGLSDCAAPLITRHSVTAAAIARILIAHSC
jgi:hypothetical protein